MRGSEKGKHLNNMITLKAPNMSEKERWTDALKRVLNEYKDSDNERKIRSHNPSKYFFLQFIFI